MSLRKFSSIRVYSFGNSYVLSSDSVKDEKLQIRMNNSSICINSLTTEEWNSLTESKTNSVTSPSYANVFTGYGCLGLLSTSVEQYMQVFQQPQQMQQPQQQQQQQQYQNVNNSNVRKDDSAAMQHFLIFVKEASSVGMVRSFEVMRITDVFVLPLNDGTNVNIYNQQMNNPNQSFDFINEIRKLLCSGTFYFSVSSDPNLTFDLTLSSQARNLSYTTNKKFLWNYNLHIPLRRLNVDTNAWLLKIICGYVEIRKVLIHAKVYRVGIISRLSCERVGARFLCRGIDDHGNVANFVETEQVVYSTETDEEVSFLQLRGSVPVFFEQTGIQVGSHRIKISRSIQACYPAFERHFQSLIQEYGNSVYVLNLLGTKGDEESLSNFYRDLCQYSSFAMTRQLLYTNFDYHQEMKLNKGSLNFKLWPDLINNFYTNSFSEGIFFYSKTSQTNINTNQVNDNDSGFGSDTSSMHHQNSTIKTQTKFIRTNCMDCLDRTNSVQSFIGKEMLRYQLRGFVESESDFRKFYDVFSQMWIANGDNISRIYAGTGAIQGRSVTKDITTSLSRAFQNNFLDDNKNDSIESFLFSMSRNYGYITDRVSVLMSKAFLRLPYSVLQEIVTRKDEYTEKEKCKVMIGTWNINGGISDYEMKQVNLNDWLIDGPFIARKTGLGYLDQFAQSDLSKLGEIDIFAIGFEEIVDLTAKNIVQASEDNASEWRSKINAFLKQHGEYVELICENLQLVGVCLFVFVLKKHVGAIRDVCVAKTKTGFGGTAGNKGGVLLRFIYYNTSMCFVCSHFAAHQKEIKQRNDDFRQIYEQSMFSGQKATNKTKILTKNHDYIFWCGDLNYRIDMPNERCRSLIAERDWNSLLELDQLSVQRNEQNVFNEFNEAPITFPPTYKYNVNEDTYDRSEKCRVPAWTDRILWRRRIYPKEKEVDVGKCLYYGRADIRFSDHRPVSSLLEVEINKVIPKKLIEVMNKVLLSFHGSFQVVLVVTTHTNFIDENVKDELLGLFMKIPTFGAYRRYKDCLYITYLDGKYGYEAFGQYNNYQLNYDDLIVQIKIEKEDNFKKIIEEELMDCLSSIDYYKNNIRKMSVLSHDHNTIDLLNIEKPKNEDENSESGSFISYINVPSQLHSNVSITNNMHKSSDLDILSLDTRHEYHNPLTKALSNSNLNVMHHTLNQQRITHSEANLLDLSNEESTFTKSLPTSIPPRPPPPPPSSSFQTQTKQDQPLIEIFTENNSGFDDDFGNYFGGEVNTNQKQSNVPLRPPPLPPLPTSSTTSNENPSQQSTVSFALFGELFEPQVKVQTQQVQFQPPVPPPRPQSLQSSSQQSQVQPQLPPRPSSQIMQPRPPPLPPMPNTSKQIPNQSSQNSIFDDFMSNSSSINITNNNMSKHMGSKPPPLPPPPKLPPRLPNQPQQSQKQQQQMTSLNSNSNNLDSLFSNFNFDDNQNTNLNTNQTTPNQQPTNLDPFDPFGDSFVINDPQPLPSPRMNHFS